MPIPSSPVEQSFLKKVMKYSFGQRTRAEMIRSVRLLPPSLAELRKRLEGRGTEDAAKVEKRLGEALNEIKLIGEYDYYIVNNDIDEAVALARSILAAESARVPEAVKPIIREYENESIQK